MLATVQSFRLTRLDVWPQKAAAAAFAALFAASAPLVQSPADAQVFGGSGYVPAPDPVIQRLQDRVQTLEQSLQAATNKAESLAFDLNQARQGAERANAANQQLEQRVAALSARLEMLERMIVGETAGSTVSTPAPNQGGPMVLGPGAGAARLDIAALPADEGEHIKLVRDLLLKGDFASAQSAASVYLERFPKGANASEAQYLLGESYLYQEAYAEAAAAYGKLLSGWPKAAKGPEGLVKLARSMRLMGQKDQACKALALMPRQFPNASQAAKTLADAEKSRAGC